MKKSNLKYVLFALVVFTIFGLYKWNQKYFESGAYTSKAVNNSGSVQYSSSQSGGSGGGSDAWNSANNEANEANQESTSSSNTLGAGSKFESNFSNNHSENNDSEYATSETGFSNQDQNSYNLNSGSVNSSSSIESGTGLTMLGVPIVLNTEPDKEEEERQQREENSNQVVKVSKGKFFDQIAGKGNVDAPMAPLPPDENIPLDGGASIILVLGSALGLKRLFGKKNLDTHNN
jgi:hypothetical protein